MLFSKEENKVKVKRALSRFLKRRAVKGRIAARKKFLPETKARAAGRKNRIGDFDTDKFYEPGVRKKSRIGDYARSGGVGAATSGAAYAVGSKSDPAKISQGAVGSASESTKKRIDDLPDSPLKSKLKKEIQRPTKVTKRKGKVKKIDWAMTDKVANKLATRAEGEAADLGKVIKKRDADYVAGEFKKESDLRKAEAQKQNKITRQTPKAQKEIRDFRRGKNKDKLPTNIGAVSGKQQRKIKAQAKSDLAKMSDDEISKKYGIDGKALKDKMQKNVQLTPGEDKAVKAATGSTFTKKQTEQQTRSKAAKDAKFNKQVAAEEQKLKNEAAGSELYIKSKARENVIKANQAKLEADSQVKVSKPKNVQGTKDKREEINTRQGKPKEGTVRAKKGGSRPGKQPFGPRDPKKNYRKVKNPETGEVETVKSRTRGTASEEKGLAQSGAAKSAEIKADKEIKKSDKKNKRSYKKSKAQKEKEGLNKAGETNEMPDPNILKDIMKKLKRGNKKPGQAGDEDFVKLSEKKKGMVYGSGIGAAVGADQARRYLRDVKLRHKQLKLGGSMETLPDSYKKKHKDWLRGHTEGKLGKRKKVGLYSKSAPKGFRKHVAIKSLGKILTPIAVAGGIGYGIDKNRRRKTSKA